MELSRPQEAALRKGFRRLNHSMILLWRLGLGGLISSPGRGYILVLATIGRKSGDRRLVPLNYAEDDCSVFLLAGFGKTTHWLLNLQANPLCEVWLPDRGRVNGRGELITNEDRRVSLLREILVQSGFAAKLAHPGMDFAAAADDDISALGPRRGVRYEVVEIKLGSSRSGSGGPGDLAWVWPVAVAALVVAATARRVRTGTSKP